MSYRSLGPSHHAHVGPLHLLSPSIPHAISPFPFPFSFSIRSMAHKAKPWAWRRQAPCQGRGATTIRPTTRACRRGERWRVQQPQRASLSRGAPPWWGRDGGPRWLLQARSRRRVARRALPTRERTPIRCSRLDLCGRALTSRLRGDFVFSLFVLSF